MIKFFRLLQLQPRRRPNTCQIIETLKQMRQSSEAIAVQQQLQYKDQELRIKDETIAQLQRQIIEMAVRSDEMRSKDEEISKLKELLRINSLEIVMPINESNDQQNKMKK